MADTLTQDRITPFYFGPPDKQLFGLYYAAQPDQEREYGVIICHPWGQEYIRAQRALSQLGLRLARQGFATLRFDYFGTGDSAGADSAGTLEQWQSDLRSAIQELKRRARVDSVYLVGLRLGASLAALVAGGRDDVNGLVLWEPAVSGAAYLQELRDWHQEKQFAFLSQGGAVADEGELLGFGLHPGLAEGLQKLDLLGMKRKPAGRILTIESPRSGEAAASRLPQLNEHFQQLGAQVEYHSIESFILWTEDPDKGLVPQAILETAVTWLAQEPL